MEDISGTNPKNKILIAGPCVIQDYDTCLYIAKEVKRCSKKYNFFPIFKASFDKANRTSVNGFRGIGIEEGMEILYSIKTNVEIPIITDVHESTQVDYVSRFTDYLQIPAFLCRQSDLIEKCAKSGLPTLIKKGQFLSPESCKFIEEKFNRFSSGQNLMIGERGNSFGYNDLIVDVTSIQRLKNSCNKSNIILDCTHSLQIPNTSEGRTKGKSGLIETMVKFGAVCDVDGLFIETHPNPKESPSDSENMLELSNLDMILGKARKIYDCL